MDKIGNWVPQIFYDLIGRIVPGSLLLIIAWGIFQGSSIIALDSETFEAMAEISSVILILISLVISYMLGALLGGIGTAANRGFWQKRSTELTNKKENDISYVYDYIQFHRPDVGSRLAKLSAERHMCQVIIVGVIILLFIYIVAILSGYSAPHWWRAVLGLVIMGISAALLRHHLSLRSRELMRNNWRLIHEENDVSKP